MTTATKVAVEAVELMMATKVVAEAEAEAAAGKTARHGTACHKR